MTLEKRVGLLEARGGGGGCPRCSGTLIVVRNTVSGELAYSRFNGEEISEEELTERQSQLRCPKCGREIGPASLEGPVIEIGGSN